MKTLSGCIPSDDDVYCGGSRLWYIFGCDMHDREGLIELFVITWTEIKGYAHATGETKHCHCRSSIIDHQINYKRCRWKYMTCTRRPKQIHIIDYWHNYKNMQWSTQNAHAAGENSLSSINSTILIYICMDEVLDMHTPHQRIAHPPRTMPSPHTQLSFWTDSQSFSTFVIPPNHMNKILTLSPRILDQRCGLLAVSNIRTHTYRPLSWPAPCVVLSTSHRCFCSFLYWTLLCHCQHVSVSQSLPLTLFVWGANTPT